ncbi:CBS domain-containing protein, partial [Desulfovibrio sp. OttesenSCG-928-M16]|nr:CBS domain-containing protein [Desulfovibrio sp. OttesenSCG-928-M16]
PDDENIRSLAEFIIATGHSRIPIYSGNRDNIIGIVHAKDLLEHALDPAEHVRPVKDIMRDPYYVPETKNVLDLLQEFRTRKVHLAVILDEYGGTAGLVTIEDVLEQIVGDIEDEHDAPREVDISLLEDGSYKISGRAYLDDLNDSLDLAIESEEVDTLGGFLTHLAGRVPEEGEQFTPEGAKGALFTVLEADPKQIHAVRLVMPGRPPESGDQAAPSAAEADGTEAD